jgi:hypothetical protein
MRVHLVAYVAGDVNAHWGAAQVAASAGKCTNSTATFQHSLPLHT